MQLSYKYNKLIIHQLKSKTSESAFVYYILMAQIHKEQLKTLFWGQEGFWN